MMKAGKYDEAIHFFTNAIALEASWAKLFFLRGQCFMKQEQLQRFLFSHFL
jgi:hypothetical protein